MKRYVSRLSRRSQLALILISLVAAATLITFVVSASRNTKSDTGNNTGLTASTGSATSTQGGNVTVNSDGSFSYNPPPGFTGADTFTYTVTDPTGKTGTGTVTLNISGMVWFINNAAASCTTLAAGCGRLTNPFKLLADFQALNNSAGNNPAANDNIFIYESATSYT